MFSTDLIAVSVATLSPLAAIGTDLYCRVENTDRVQLFRGADYPLRSDDLSRLKSRGVHQLFIARESRARYQEYLRDLAAGRGDETANGEQRSAALNEVVLDVLETSFRSKNTDHTVNSAAQLSGLAASLVTREDFAANDLFRVLHHDYATFTHSANVAYYAGILAHELGFSEQDVELVITGGFLHDLGKLYISDTIPTKPTRLDDEEFREIQKHPLTGFRQVAERADLTHAQLMMIYQHHERLDGGGYPVGCTADEIHPWAKLCSVVDVYEAVTSQRPYRTPMSRCQAIELLQRQSGDALDPEMVQCWISIIQNATLI